MNDRLDLVLHYGAHMRRFRLPPEMDRNHSIWVPSVGKAKKRVLINLKSTSGKWRVAPGEYECPEHDFLTLDQSVPITALSGEAVIDLCLRVLDPSVTRYEKYRIDPDDGGEITVGGGEDDTVRIEGGTRTLAAVTLAGGKAAIRPLEDIPVFINGTRIAEKCVLKPLDSIYIYHINFIYLGPVLAINRIGNGVQCTLPLWEPDPRKTGDASPVHKTVDFQRSTQLRLGLIPEVETLDAPPTPKTQRLAPFILQAGASLSMFVVMAASLTVRVTMGAANRVLAIVSILAMVGSLSGMVIFPMLMRRYQARKTQREEEERYAAYQKYLTATDGTLAAKMSEDRELLKNKFPSPAEVLLTAHGLKRELWGRAPVYREFLDIRIGIGRRPALHPAQIPAEGFVMSKDPCRILADELVRKYQYIPNAPMSIELMKFPIIGIFGNRAAREALVESVILQIAAQHSYDDVKIILLYDRNDGEMHFGRWLPHAWNHERNFRYLASNKQEVDKVFDRLKPLFDERREKKEKQQERNEVFSPHYVVISLSPGLLRNEILHREFLSSYEDIYDMGISFIAVDWNLSGMPILSNILIQCTNSREAYIHLNDGKSKDMPLFEPDSITEPDWPDQVRWPYLARHLFRTRTMDISENNLLPQSLSFMGMYNATSLEELGILNRWAQNDCARNITAPVGVTASDIFNLDIHEKGHGPHGLIAGTTGSGKSEFIQTLILSLCVNYSPEDVVFILIDYKGGGTVNIFQALPHLAGSITNLGGNQIQRSLTSINSELKRRQRMLADCGDPSVNSIDKYNRLRKKKPGLPPMPHLVMIADEFAELKNEQRDFMQKVISASRIGRSLGIHLLLATQKPTGVVDEQIWSNTRFRVCLKVADKADSNDMIKKFDAADITRPGRAYVQVGNDEIYQQIQSGYSGAPFFTGKDAGRELAEIFYIQHNGEVSETLSAKEPVIRTTETKTQLETIVNHIKELAAGSAFSSYRLWQEPLPEKLFWDDLAAGNNAFPPCFDPENGTWAPYIRWMAPVIGILDDVVNQQMPLLELDFARDGHMIVFGIRSAGKTTLLQTMIYALATQYTPEDLNLYILDYDLGAMRYCEQLPHTGGVIVSEDTQRLKSLFLHLEKELDKRKKLLSDKGLTDLQNYIAEGEEKISAIVVIIHSFETFAEECDPYLERVQTLVRDGAKNGIFFVLTGSTRGSVPLKIQKHIKTYLCLQMMEPQDYKMTLFHKDDDDTKQPEPVSGRGLIKRGRVMEFHTAVVVKPEEGVQRATELHKKMVEKCVAMRQAWTGKCAPALAAIPDPYLLLPSLAGDAYQETLQGGGLPLGYNIKNNALVSLAIKNTFVYPIIGGMRTGKTNMLKCLIRMGKAVPDAKIYIFDSGESPLHMLAKELGLEKNYAKDKHKAEELTGIITQSAKERGPIWLSDPSSYFSPVFIFIDDIVHFFKMAEQETVTTLDALMPKGGKYGIHFFVTGAKMEILKGQAFHKTIFHYEHGMLLGGNLEAYDYFNAEISMALRSKQYPPGMGYIFNKGKFRVIKTAAFEAYESDNTEEE